MTDSRLTPAYPSGPVGLTKRGAGEIRWSEPGPVVAVVGARGSVRAVTTLTELWAEVRVASGAGDITVELLVNDVVVATLTLPQGQLVAGIPLSIVALARPEGFFYPRVSEPGSGADTITITVVHT